MVVPTHIWGVLTLGIGKDIKDSVHNSTGVVPGVIGVNGNVGMMTDKLMNAYISMEIVIDNYSDMISTGVLREMIDLISVVWYL